MAQEANDERFERGMEVLQQIGGEGFDLPIKRLAEASPDLARFTVEYPYGDILSRPGLDLPLRQMGLLVRFPLRAFMTRTTRPIRRWCSRKRAVCGSWAAR